MMFKELSNYISMSGGKLFMDSKNSAMVDNYGITYWKNGRIPIVHVSPDAPNQLYVLVHECVHIWLHDHILTTDASLELYVENVTVMVGNLISQDWSDYRIELLNDYGITDHTIDKVKYSKLAKMFLRVVNKS